MNGLGALQNYVTGGEVTQAYRDILGRAPDTSGAQFYTNPNLSLADLRAQLADSAEGRAYAANPNRGIVTPIPAPAPVITAPPVTAPPTTGGKTVADLYREYFKREPDAEGLKSWTDMFGDSVDATELAKFLAAPSTKAEIASKNATASAVTPTITPTAVVNAPKKLEAGQINNLYRQTFGREGDAGGIANALSNGVTRDQLVNQFLNSQEYRVPSGITAVAPRRESMTLQAPTVISSGIRSGVPMEKLTAADVGSRFVAPEDYSKVFQPETNYTTNDPLLTEATTSAPVIEAAAGGYMSENPAYSEYMAAAAEGGSVNMARGGSVPQSNGLHGAAQHLADKGRKGDTTLVHMTDEEVKGLQALAQAKGGSLTINPETGLVEAGFLKDIFKSIGKVLPFIAPFIPGVGPLMAAGISGLAGATSGGGFNLKKGLMSGLMSYGLSGLNTAGGAAADAGTKVGIDASVQGAPLGSLAGAGSAATEAGTPGIMSNISDKVAGTVSNIKNAGTNVFNAASGDKAAQAAIKTVGENSLVSPTTAAVIGGSGVIAADTADKYANQQNQIQSAEDDKKEAMKKRVAEIMRGNPLPQDFSMAGGGLTSFAHGGATAPRMLDGPGDGMSDSIPAMIGNKQPARLADGEFVIPADIVSHLGNGSSKAGAKQLYSMMDRIRKARTGRDSQAPQVRASKLMPV